MGGGTQTHRQQGGLRSFHLFLAYVLKVAISMLCVCIPPN
jgi:hypothetical protein